MKLTFEAFARPLFGPRYQGAVRALLVSGIVFSGCGWFGLRWSLPLPTLYLLVTAGTGGHPVAVFGRRGTLPQPGKPLYAARFIADLCVLPMSPPLGSHTLLTKTVPLLAALLAVSVWPPVALGGAFSAGFTGSWSPPLSLSRGPGLWVDCGPPPWPPCSCWGNRARGSSWVWPPAACWPVGSCGTRTGTPSTGRGEARLPRHRFSGRPSLGRYLVRYLLSHKNYLVNTGILWGMAWVLPLFFRQVAGCGWPRWGFALLSFNTPWGSCCPATPAPNRPSVFCRGRDAPSAFPTACSSAPAIWLRRGSFCAVGSFKSAGFRPHAGRCRLLCPLESAILAVLLEWFFPIRSWKTESDLWHHPRKYVVPGILLFLAVLVGAQPGILPVLLVGLTLEAAVLLFLCLRGEPLP